MGVFTLGVPVANNPLMNLMSQFLSPYQTNPLDINPLRKLLERVVDFDMLAQVWGQEGMPKLFVCATNVRTGKGEIFSEQRISADAIMASACLPQLYQAVEIDGEYYWDGGFSGNPALYPLIYRTDCSDMLLVQINPIESPDLPDTASDIAERMNEVMFNAGLLGELRAIDFVRRLLAEGKLDPSATKACSCTALTVVRPWPVLVQPASRAWTWDFCSSCLHWGAGRGSSGCRTTAMTWACARRCRLWTIHSSPALRRA